MKNILQMAAAMNAVLEQIAGIMLDKEDMNGNRDTTPVSEMTIEDTHETLRSIIRMARQPLADLPDTSSPESSPFIWLNDGEQEGIAVCGCRLHHTPDNEAYDNPAFTMCPTHAAAPDLLEALKEIAKGEGAFSQNLLLHARNTIDNMKSLARGGIAEATQ